MVLFSHYSTIINIIFWSLQLILINWNNYRKWVFIIVVRDPVRLFFTRCWSSPLVRLLCNILIHHHYRPSVFAQWSAFLHLHTSPSHYDLIEASRIMTVINFLLFSANSLYRAANLNWMAVYLRFLLTLLSPGNYYLDQKKFVSPHILSIYKTLSSFNHIFWIFSFSFITTTLALSHSRILRSKL